jgi:galactosamine-6-phosphate isomerase
MKIHYHKDYGQMSRSCAHYIIEALKRDPEQLICTATGNSPTGVYQEWTKSYQMEPEPFETLKIIKLDEWGGIPMADPGSCETFIQDRILSTLNIGRERYISLNSDPDSPEKECERMQRELEQQGPIDICLLGLGKNGHIGFNEPAASLNPHCHVVRLSETSLNHQMTGKMGDKPRYGLTLGMIDILSSKKIILLMTGEGKKDIFAQLMSKKISTELPASLLWGHADVECYVDLSSV